MVRHKAKEFDWKRWMCAEKKWCVPTLAVARNKAKESKSLALALHRCSNGSYNLATRLKNSQCLALAAMWVQNQVPQASNKAQERPPWLYMLRTLNPSSVRLGWTEFRRHAVCYTRGHRSDRESNWFWSSVMQSCWEYHLRWSVRTSIC